MTKAHAKDGRGTEHGFLAVERLDMVLGCFSFWQPADAEDFGFASAHLD